MLELEIRQDYMSSGTQKYVASLKAMHVLYFTRNSFSYTNKSNILFINRLIKMLKNRVKSCGYNVVLLVLERISLLLIYTIYQMFIGIEELINEKLPYRAMSWYFTSIKMNVMTD